ncbi:DUF6268 family outer membrane beta-barrel protein [uncultured Sphingobacterium sp.]|uniref:DUF6268 family outer membrane beta-barrel protein n=1 Tax=uncultured Sphingobacterium sp. TaxID=182688 RepID=UPI0025E15128|nr:DUF6268 family outer membrane beta-barrel protein [uncultured Sphingobacterium sp.]
MFFNHRNYSTVLVIIFSIFFSKFTYSQVIDSVSANKRKKILSETLERFPINRPLNVEYMQLIPYSYSSELYGNEIPKTKVKSLSQINVYGSIPIIRKKKWSIGTSLKYQNLSGSVEETDPTNNLVVEKKESFHNFAASVNFTYYARLFNKSILLTASPIVDGGNEGFERITGIATATWIMKATATKRISLGAAGIIDPSAQIPAFLTFSYEQKFKNGYSLDLILPSRLMIRKEIFENGRISAGTEMGGLSFYLYNIDNSGKTYSYRQMFLNSGFTYEHNLGKTLIATFKTGVRNALTTRIVEKGGASRDYIFKSSQDPTFYFNIGVSFNPFRKKN